MKSFCQYLEQRFYNKHDDIIRERVRQALEGRQHFPLFGNLVIEMPQLTQVNLESRIAFFLRTEFKDHKGMPYADNIEVHKITSDKPGIMKFHVSGMEKNWQDRVFDYLPQ